MSSGQSSGCPSRLLESPQIRPTEAENCLKGLNNEDFFILAVVFSNVVPHSFWSGCNCHRWLHPRYKKNRKNLSVGVADWSDSFRYSHMFDCQCLEDSAV